MSAIDTCLDNNAKYASTFGGAKLDAAPSMQLTIVTCMDARIDPTLMLGLAPGEAHVIRNGGGIVTEDVIRSIAVSQNVLGTREVMLIQHTECGFLRLSEEELKDRIEGEAGARPDFTMGAFEDLENNLRRSIEIVRTSPYLSSKDVVRGFIYDVRTGLLSETS